MLSAMEQTPENGGAVEPQNGAPAGAPGVPGEPSKNGAARAPDDAALARQVAVLLFASPEPLSAQRLAALIPGAGAAEVRAAVEDLARRLEEARLPITIHELAGGWRLLSAPDMHDVVARLARARRAEKVTPAALETLAVVAYRQPVTKAEIEAIRGVQSGPVLRSLAERGLVRVTGRADQPGSPLQYGTTKAFLDQFALAAIEDLPRDPELVRD
jgi:segregation and condensation protein B